MPRAAAVIVAAGRGERFGLDAKALVPLLGRPMLAWSLDAIEEAASVREIVVVAGTHTRDRIAALLAEGAWDKVVAVVEGGLRRQDSVAVGVHALSSNLDVVLIHDAARPLATAAQYDACARLAAHHGAAIVAAPVSDTLKRVADGLVTATVTRDGLWMAQTPQGFRRDDLVAALRSPAARETTLTDDAALFEALGWPVAIVPGDRANLKVTFPSDLAMAEALLRTRYDERVKPGTEAPGSPRKPAAVG
ncbi:MAG: 2-C-methyl-D-erythritol 4-phosphate cytidylyltransferase [Chloroflexia bacterium]|nr:2-C-methyl-D-erythritol 4-phosphate cytidylyltransferase [Chloroflexia bacterium]